MKHVCPYTKTTITKQNSITFTCGHSYLADIFQELSIEIFTCCVSGCIYGDDIAVIGDYERDSNFEVDSDLIEVEAPTKIIEFVDLETLIEEQEQEQEQEQGQITHVYADADPVDLYLCFDHHSQESNENKSEGESMLVGTSQSPILVSDGEEEDLGEENSYPATKKKKTHFEEEIENFDFSINHFLDGLAAEPHLVLKESNATRHHSKTIHEMVKEVEQSDYATTFRRKATIPQFQPFEKRSLPPCLTGSVSRCKNCNIERKGNTKMIRENYTGVAKFICTSKKCTFERCSNKFL